MSELVAAPCADGDRTSARTAQQRGDRAERPDLGEMAGVLGVPAAEPDEALDWFWRSRLRCETDPYDVYHDLVAGAPGFVVLDTRRRESYDEEHVAGAVSFSHHDMTAESVTRLDPDVVYVTYGWGPGCNAGTKGAARLAAFGLRVKEMIGGIEYWKRAGYPTEKES